MAFMALRGSRRSFVGPKADVALLFLLLAPSSISVFDIFKGFEDSLIRNQVK
jgi:hypothetical protein